MIRHIIKKKYLFFLLTFNISHVMSSNSVNSESSTELNIYNSKNAIILTAENIEDLVYEKRSKSNKIGTAMQVVSVAAIIYVLYNYIIDNKFNNFKSSDNENNENIEKDIILNKKKSYIKEYFQKIENKLVESYFGEFLGMIYRELFFPFKVSMFLNDTFVGEILKDELKNKFLLSEQAQASLFSETLGLLLSVEDFKAKIKKAIKAAMNVSMTAITLIAMSALGHYKLNSYIKHSVDSKLDTIEYLKKRPITKKVTQIALTSGIDSYIVAPLLCSFAILMIQGIEELLSDNHVAIKKGNLFRLSREMITENSSITKKYKDIQDGAKISIKSIISLRKIIKNMYIILSK